MPIQTVTQRNNMCARYAADCLWLAVYSTVPGVTAGTELVGGVLPYARKAANWGAPANSAVVGAPAAHDIPSGATAAGVGFHTAVTAGTYLDGAGVTSMTFSSQGTLAITPTYTQT
jgi:hypothetical protein